MRRALFDNGLAVFFGSLFLATIAAQSVVGEHALNNERKAHGEPTVSWADYVLSSDFGQAVMENWQSEFLQFTLFIAATIWLVQRGSNESKSPDDVGLESDRQQLIGSFAPEDAPTWARVRGWRTTLYSHSLLLVMLTIFLLSWLAQSLTAWRAFNEEQVAHRDPSVSWAGYVTEPAFWEATLQNWQSEFLAVGALAVFTIYLRQRGSPESKPVGAPHDQTGSAG